ncbi:MAG: hypothetical protein H6923_00120 [Alphaproteobacteria bacterium]|nr:hypothetical protein [Alphaproteobacteria bacterium]
MIRRVRHLRLPRPAFAPRAGERRLKAFFLPRARGLSWRFAPHEIAALRRDRGLCVGLTQKGAVLSLRLLRAKARRPTHHAATRANLESRACSGARARAAFATIDRTLTSGGRLLARRLQAPLTDLSEILRADALQHFLEARAAHELRDTCGGFPERALQRSRSGAAACATSARSATRLPRRDAALSPRRGLSERRRFALARLEADGLGATARPRRAFCCALRARFCRPPSARAALPRKATRPSRRLRARSARRAGAHRRTPRRAYAETAAGARTLRIKHNGMLGYFHRDGRWRRRALRARGRRASLHPPDHVQCRPLHDASCPSSRAHRRGAGTEALRARRRSSRACRGSARGRACPPARLRRRACRARRDARAR